MKEVISSVLMPLIKKEGFSMKKEEIEKLIEIPPSIDMGDYAFPCFYLASKLKSPPNSIWAHSVFLPCENSREMIFRRG